MAIAAHEMPRTYDHRSVEERLYAFWESRGYFTPKIDWSRKPFVIAMPPPNITGELHHGHAMFVAFQDLMIRWRRMQGYPTLWLPGTDHAGIATQNVVEAELAREGLTRFDLGREKFVERVWQWKEKYGSIITMQLRRLGASCDWTRERFTMDPGLSRAVREAFVRLYRKGLIYRGQYIINWCPRCETAISDLEVEHVETPGKLYLVRYPLADEHGDAIPGQYITVATTRPETILGDTGIAVHPEDERYTGLVGQRAIVPVVGRVVPIVADAAVDPAFGTGAVKVTPAHDPTDFEIGRRHQLPAVNVLTPKAQMNENAGPYAGMDRYECRRALVRDLERLGLLVRVEDHLHAVGHCSRCDTPVEPWLSEQWFVRIKPLAEPAIAAVREGRIRFIPERFTRIYFNWMENIRDWCISRQLWWGHQIPVWYCLDCGQTIVEVETPARCPRCGSTDLRQDPDVLDTWFSSALWPFSTLGWPEETEDYRYFYPTDVMETGYDIIFFWVARMIMMGLECTGKEPFRDVYLHGLMRDEKGEKMSKSKGNVANPLDVIQKYGADALRFTIITGSSPGNDMRLTDERLAGSRNFANKLWNMGRFILLSGQTLGPEAQTFTPSAADLTLADRWILSRLSRVVADVTRLMEEYEFGEAGRILHDFAWSEFADWYIEIAKIRLYGAADQRARYTAQHVLYRTMDTLLRLLHPFMPFVTEEIWQHLPHEGESLMIAAWPTPGPTDEAAERDMERLMEVVRAIRSVRSEFRVEPTRRVEVIAVSDAPDLLRREAPIVQHLAGVEPWRVETALPTRPTQAVHVVAAGVELYLPLAGMVDIAAERQRLKKEAAATWEHIVRLQGRLGDPEFLTKAPAVVVERERARLAELEDKLAKIREQLAVLGE